MIETVAQPSLLFTIFNWVVVIGVLVTVHEFGHYLAGRWFGVKAEVFSVGFGRELLGYTDSRGTRWKLSMLPLGGYVKFLGDANATSMADASLEGIPQHLRSQTLQAKPLWQRAVVVAAGPITNFLFAIVIFAAIFTAVGHPFTQPVAATVLPGSAADAAGVKVGDRIVAIDGERVSRFEDVQRLVALNTGLPIALELARGKETVRISVTPSMAVERDPFGREYQRPRLGIAAAVQSLERVGPVRATGYAVEETWKLIKLIVSSIGQIVSGERSMKELGGPLKIAQFSGEAAALGVVAFVHFIALVSINLGFINLLPVPVLDGGHLLLYALEGARRRPLSQRTQGLAFMSGFAALLTLMLVLTWNDLASFGVWKHLASVAG